MRLSAQTAQDRLEVPSGTLYASAWQSYRIPLRAHFEDHALPSQPLGSLVIKPKLENGPVILFEVL